jgi:hypothetical protein
MFPLVPVSAFVFLGLAAKWHFSRRPSEPVSTDKSSEKKKEKEKTKGPPVTDPNWQWSIYDEYTEKDGRKKLTKREGKADEDTENGPFRVIYRVKKHQQWPDVVKIHLFSRPLCKVLEQYLPNNGDLKTLSEPKLPGRELCIVLDALKDHVLGSNRGSEEADHNGLANGNGVVHNHGLANGELLKIRELTNGNAGIGDDAKAEKKMDEGELHLKHLVRFLEKEYRDVPVRVKRMLEVKEAAWDLLWAFLYSGKKVVYKCDHSEELLYAVVSNNYFQFSMFDGWLFVVVLDIWEFDGRRYRQCQVTRTIKQYEGESSFASLAVCPVELLGMQESLEERFLDNGKKYLDLTIKHKHRFMHYTGSLFQKRQDAKSCWQLHKEHADGRVMIDMTSFAKMNPYYPMGNARPPTASSCWWSRRSDGSYSICSVPGQSQDPAFDASDVSDENLMFAPGIVYGFSFTLKMWGSFAINGFQDISFDSSAFHELVMEPNMKGLVRNLVGHYIGTPVAGSQPLQRVDPISNKGNGCVFLCYGPPGTGKTLTAESIAETMGRPLWALSVSELGTTPKELEQTLFKVLDIAAAWRAVLLLDEADVYLERRVSGADITRNAMTGIFLRMLEYYRGVLFLTTNRIGTFDEAFRSRISMFMHYSALSTQHKEQIWRNLLEKARVANVSSDKLSELAALELNGREIRNAIHTAQSWAQSNGENLELQHVQYVMGVVATSLKSLNEVLHASAAN